jgi:hypothetical protein
MAAKRLAVLIVLVVFAASGWAQVNEVSATVGRTFVSTQTVPSTNLPIILAMKKVSRSITAVCLSHGVFWDCPGNCR